MGSQLWADGQKSRLDCRSAIAASTGAKRALRQAACVGKVRVLVKAKHEQLEWIEGHVGHVHNKVSNDYAQQGTTLSRPPAPPSPPRPNGTLSGTENWFYLLTRRVPQ